MPPDDRDQSELFAQEVQDRLSFRFGPERAEWFRSGPGPAERRAGNLRAILGRIGEWKLEILDGQIAGSDAQRLAWVGLLVESLGLDQVVQLGDPENWMAAVEKWTAGRSAAPGQRRKGPHDE